MLFSIELSERKYRMSIGRLEARGRGSKTCTWPRNLFVLLSGLGISRERKRKYLPTRAQKIYILMKHSKANNYMSLSLHSFKKIFYISKIKFHCPSSDSFIHSMTYGSNFYCILLTRSFKIVRKSESKD